MQLSRLRIAFDILAIVFFVYIIMESLEFRSLAGYFPLSVASSALVLGIVNLGIDVTRILRHGSAIAGSEMETAAIKESADPVARRQALLRMARYVGWFVGYIALIYVFGMRIASPLFLFAFFWRDAKTGLPFAVLGAAGGTAVLLLASDVMKLRWPESLFSFFG